MILPRNLLLNLFIIYYIILKSDAYRILGVFPFNMKSHNYMFESVMKSLANRGHQVDVITHFELKNPPKNYRTIIDLAGTKELYVNNVTMEKVYLFELKDMVKEISSFAGNVVCELLSLDGMQKLTRKPPSDPPYDLVITESLGANCYIGLGYVLKVPVIGISTTLEFPWTGATIGNPPSTAFAHNLISRMEDISTFSDRLKNTLTYHIYKNKFFWYTEEAQTEVMRKYLSPDIPSIREVEKSVALIFVNSHHSIYGVRPTTPALIEIGGIHIEGDETKFTTELKTWMDESKNGVIYFTLGSMVLIETLPKKTLLAIYASFAKIVPVRVLMKIVDKDKLPPGLPKNVLSSSWIPQIPVLSHNNMRLFMTHGGLNGIQEALYHGIPMIGFPLFADQFLNVDIFTKKNIMLKMDYRNISEKSLDEAINAILYDPKYRQAAKRESFLYRDRPMKAKDTAIFWVEYVIRNGANALRSPAVDLQWWQVELLDVYGFIILCIFIIVYITILMVKIFLRLFCKILRYRRGYREIHIKFDKFY